MLFYSFFKTLVGSEVSVHLKNDLVLRGNLASVDQYLNVKLTSVLVQDQDAHPHLISLTNCFIRGSVIRYLELQADKVDTTLLQDAARKEAMGKLPPAPAAPSKAVATA